MKIEKNKIRQESLPCLLKSVCSFHFKANNRLVCSPLEYYLKWILLVHDLMLHVKKYLTAKRFLATNGGILYYNSETSIFGNSGLALRSAYHDLFEIFYFKF